MAAGSAKVAWPRSSPPARKSIPGVEETHVLGFSADEACDVGQEAGSPVSPDYGPRGNEFSGEVHWVQIDLGLDDQSHLVRPEQRLSFALARQ